MRINIFNKFRNSEIIIFVIIIFFITGCTVPMWKLKDVSNKKPVILFNNYILKVSGGTGTSSDMFYFNCDVSFLSRINDTLNLNTIPIIKIDSMYFKGECITSKNKIKMLSYYEKYSKEKEFDERSSQLKHYFTEDLYVHNGNIFPDGFLTNSGITLKVDCKEIIEIEIYSHIIDRITHNVISSEIITLYFEIKKSMKWFNTSVT